MNSQSQPISIAIAQAPVSTVSPDGTRIDATTPTAKITAADGGVWTVLLPQVSGVAGQCGLARNGVRQSSSIDYGTIKGGVFWAADFLSGSGWQKWVGTTWVNTGTVGP